MKFDQTAGGATPEQDDNDASHNNAGDNKRSRKKNSKRNGKRGRRDNRYHFRGDSEIDAIVLRTMAKFGLSESEALRMLVKAGDGQIVAFEAKSPPAHVEALLGRMDTLHRDMVLVRSRLNAPLPLDPRDPKLIEYVEKWRKIADEAIAEFPKLRARLISILEFWAEITPDRIERVKDYYLVLEKSIADAEVRLKRASDYENILKQQDLISFWTDCQWMIEYFGFIKK